MSRPRRKTLGCFVALGLGVACNSPTLPLPPPNAPEEVRLSADATRADLAGAGAQPGALVLVFNEEPSVQAGVIVTADGQGRYRLTVPIDLSVNPRNQLELWQRVGTQDSSLVTFHVPLSGTRGEVPRADAATPADADVEAQPDEASVDAGATR